MKKHSVASAALFVLLAMSACATTPSPQFDGPWAAEFEKEYTSATSSYVRTALEDGVVSEQEYAETVTRFTACLSAVGITINELLPTGEMDYTYSGDNSDDAVAHEEECSNQSGQYPIGMLYSWVYANPQNVDVAELTVACLIRAGVVLPDYSPDDYRKEAPTGNISLTVEGAPAQEALTQCAQAPLTAFSE